MLLSSQGSSVLSNTVCLQGFKFDPKPHGSLFTNSTELWIRNLMLCGMFSAWKAWSHFWCFSALLSFWQIPVYRFFILMIYKFVKWKHSYLGFLGNAVLDTPGLIRGLISLPSSRIKSVQLSGEIEQKWLWSTEQSQLQKKRVLLDGHKVCKVLLQIQNKMIQRFCINLSPYWAC